MAKVNWGIPKIYVKDNDLLGSKWYRLPTPVEDSTQLTSNQGDKMEAKVEGGENEDVKYKRSTYEFAYNLRMLKGRKAPFPIEDGVVDHHFGLMLQPEDEDCEGFYIESSTVRVDQTYSASEGSRWEIHHDAIKAQNGDTVKWGKVTVSGSTITFAEGSSDEVTNGTIADDSSLDVIDISPVTYTKVTNTTGKNPSTEGWFERTGTSPNYTYTLTTDTTPSSSKSYYVKNG